MRIKKICLKESIPLQCTWPAVIWGGSTLLQSQKTLELRSRASLTTVLLKMSGYLGDPLFTR